MKLASTEKFLTLGKYPAFQQPMGANQRFLKWSVIPSSRYHRSLDGIGKVYRLHTCNESAREEVPCQSNF